MPTPRTHSSQSSKKNSHTENLKKSVNTIKQSTSSSIPPNLEKIMYPSNKSNNPFFTGHKAFSISKGTSMASSLRSNRRNGSKPTKTVRHSRIVHSSNSSTNLTNFSEKRQVRRRTK